MQTKEPLWGCRGSIPLGLQHNTRWKFLHPTEQFDRYSGRRGGILPQVEFYTYTFCTKFTWIFCA